MMTAEDKVKRFKTLLLSPHVLTDDEMRALWDIARHPGKIMFRHNDHNASRMHPTIWTWKDNSYIIIPRHIIGTLERRGILKRQCSGQYVPEQDMHVSWYTWDIVWKKMRTFEQTKELQMQVALGSI